MCDYYRADVETAALKFVHEAEYISVVCYAEIAPDFIILYISSGYNNDYFGLLFQLEQHMQLGIGLEARQNSGSMVIVEELAAELEIKLAAELTDPLSYHV